MRKIKGLIVLLLLMVVSGIFSCTSSLTEENGTVGDMITTPSPTTTTTVPTETTTTPPPTTEPYYPVTGSLDLSRLPLPGEETEVTFSINVVRAWEGIWQIVGATSETLADSKAWVTVFWAGIDSSYSEARQYTEIPVEEIAVSGDTSWEGNALENSTIELKSTIRLTKEGKWVIMGTFTGANWGRPLKYSQYVAVADGIALPYYSHELKSSPLAYLEYFDYGLQDKLPPDEQSPLSVEVDMTHPPLAGEEVVLTYRVRSPYVDVENFSARTRFYKRGEDNQVTSISTSDVLISGDLEWATSFNKDELVELSAIMRLPEPGEWRIELLGDYPARPEGIGPFRDEIEVTITEDKAYYGWKERFVKPTTHYTGPTTITTSPVE